MIEAAEKDGHLKPGGTIIEPTSGNTGVGLAMVAAVKGYKLVLVMPESMSIERRRLMLAYGATFDLTPREKGMKGAIERALELVEQTPNAGCPQQFENPANIDVHVRTTSQEILADFADMPIDVLITGVGTGGHITGVAEALKKVWPTMKVYAVGTRRLARHRGWPAGAAPDPGDRRRLHPRQPPYPDPGRRDRGRCRGRQGHGAAIGDRGGDAGRHLVGRELAAILQKLPDLPDDARVLGFNYDTGERYLSVPDFLPEH